MTRSSEDRPRCEECGGPLGGAGLRGRPWPHRAPTRYCCFGCLSLGEQTRGEHHASRATIGLGSLGFRLGIALVVAGQSTIFGLALNLHDDVPASVRSLVQWLIFGSTLLVVALLGGPLARTAWGELRRGRLTIEALFLLTMAGALAASLQAQLTGRGKIYFEVVSILLVVYSIGKVVGARSRAKVLAASRAWSGHLELCRRIDDAGVPHQAPVKDIVPGDRVEVRAGETIPVDGTIREGLGFASEAAVSGEPFPVLRRPGDAVLAGAASFDATFRIEATRRGTERHIDRLLAVVDGARDTPLSLQSQADRLAQWFLPLVVLVAGGTFGYWTFLTDRGWEEGLFNAMAVLLVACPCAIGLATPVAVWSALGRLAERGLIVRTADAIERLAEVDRVFVDKTGTLTDEEPRLCEVEIVDSRFDRERVLGWLSLLESQSNHPLAKPFVALPQDGKERVEAVRTVPGCGIEGTIIDENGVRRLVRIGRPGWLEPEEDEGLEPAGSRRIIATIGGVLAARAVVAEWLRTSSVEALSQFHALGVPGEVITGDSRVRTALPGDVPVRTGLLPDDKRMLVEAARRTGAKPLMVGDGINDAAALATAHVGIAMASGTELAVEAADATLYGGDLRALPWAVAVSRDAVRTVRRNLMRAVAYNLAGMALAACGLLHPIAAVLLMMASSISLLAASSRFRSPSYHFVKSEVRERNPRIAATVHGFAFAFQSVLLILLAEAYRDPIIAMPLLIGFSAVGFVMARAWLRRGRLSHEFDMAFGMLTLGNLGMLLGWWFDAGFAPLREAGCEACIAAARQGAAPGMWIGMLVFANLAMAFLGRRQLPTGPHRGAMFTGGNAGMVLGMLAGGWCAAQLPTTKLAAALPLALTGMTAGMVTGMLIGTRLVERALDALRPSPNIASLAASSVSER